jgi:hypothetical protein
VCCRKPGVSSKSPGNTRLSLNNNNNNNNNNNSDIHPIKRHRGRVDVGL